MDNTWSSAPGIWVGPHDSPVWARLESCPECEAPDNVFLGTPDGGPYTLTDHGDFSYTVTPHLYACTVWRNGVPARPDVVDSLRWRE